MDKKGEALVYPLVIFVVLNIIFITLLMLFVFKSSTGALIYEQTYAKELALLIDGAKPGMEINFNFEKGFEIAEKNKLSSESIENLVTFKDYQVTVKLSNSGGYSFNYFSDYDVSSSFEGHILKIIVKEK